MYAGAFRHFYCSLQSPVGFNIGSGPRWGRSWRLRPAIHSAEPKGIHTALNCSWFV